MGIDASIQILGYISDDTIDAINTRIGTMLDDQNMTDGYGNYFAYSDNGVAEFMTLWRYWGPGYERGPWFNIAGVLMTAKGMCNNEVRYGGDDDDTLPIVTSEMLSKYWLHFIGPNGNDYREYQRNILKGH